MNFLMRVLTICFSQQLLLFEIFDFLPFQFHFTEEYYKHEIKIVWTLAEHTTVRLFPPDGM